MHIQSKLTGGSAPIQKIKTFRKNTGKGDKALEKALKQKKLIRGSSTYKKWELKPGDLERGLEIKEQEQVRPITEKSIFCAGIYCILSASEDYPKQMRTYNRLMRKGFDSAEKMLSNLSGLEDILSITRFPNEKFKRVRGYSQWWLKSNIAEKIIADVKTGRKKEFEIRKEIAKNCPGLSYKGAALLLGKFGYQNVVPIDIWMLRFLRDNGYDVRVSDYKTVSGLKDSEYAGYERSFRNIARKNGFTPMLYQCILWGKYSKWKKADKKHQKSLDLF